jgi:glycosyltransferase involved in cell wall biosynthesis
MKVSCVMPTRDRRPFVARAIAYFLRQDHPDRELVIADDGDDPVSDLARGSPLIRYVWLERRLVLGEKRNVVNDLTEGEILLHWDDDDWSAPNRISRQVSLLQATGADLCGAGDQVYYRPSTDRAWRYRYPQRDCWVAGNTLCYLRSRWKEHPFEPVPEGEDNRFVRAGRRPVEVAGVFHIGILHPGNASPKRTYGSRWSHEPAATVHRHLGPDLALYR